MEQRNDGEEEEIKETKWTDDIVRGLHDDSNSDSDEDEEVPFDDPFKDPDPTEQFSFQFPQSSLSSSEGGVEVVLQGYKADSDQTWKSTGLTIWRAAKLLSDYVIDRHPEELLKDNANVMELGAGLGLCGILVHLLAKNCDVCLTDGDTDALKALRENIRHNQHKSQNQGTISCHQLLWGRQTTEDFLQRHPKKVDLLIASDIVYTKVVVQPLWETVQTILHQDGMFLFAYCSRRDVPISIELVLEASDQAGFTHQLVDDRDGVLVYIFRWKIAESL